MSMIVEASFIQPILWHYKSTGAQNPTNGQRARDVLHEAMQIDEAARSAFLNSQCATIRRCVRS